MRLENMTEAPPSDVRAYLSFVFWAVVLGPVAYMALLLRALDMRNVPYFFAAQYIVAVLHIFFYSVVFGAALLWHNRITLRRPRPLHLLIKAALVILVLVLAAAGIRAFLAAIDFHPPGPARPLLSHILKDVSVAAIVVAAQRLYVLLIRSREQAQHRLLERERALRMAIEARWCSLESRVRPYSTP